MPEKPKTITNIPDNDWRDLKVMCITQGVSIGKKLTELIRAEVLRNKLKEG